MGERRCWWLNTQHIVTVLRSLNPSIMCICYTSIHTVSPTERICHSHTMLCGRLSICLNVFIFFACATLSGNHLYAVFGFFASFIINEGNYATSIFSPPPIAKGKKMTPGGCVCHGNRFHILLHHRFAGGCWQREPGRQSGERVERMCPLLVARFSFSSVPLIYNLIKEQNFNLYWEVIEL